MEPEKMTDIKELQDFIHQHIKLRPQAIEARYPKQYEQILAITSFLPNDAPLRQRYHHIINNRLFTEVCVECGANSASWILSTKQYSNFCSKSCSRNSILTKEKTKQTCLKKYGVTSVGASEQAKQKKKQTCLERYGVEDPLKLASIQQKKKQTCLDRYGVDNPSKNIEIQKRMKLASQKDWEERYDEKRSKFKQTCMEKYGAENPQQNAQIRNKREQTNLEKYGNINVMKNPDVANKKDQTCLDRYGDVSVSRSKLSDFCKAKIQDKEWLIEQHHNQERTITNIAKELQIDTSSLVKYYHKFNIQLKKFSHSQGEREIGEFLKENNISHICNTKQIISPLELDIFIPEHNIAIEYCGLFWHSDLHPRIDNQYHVRKLEMCEEKGIRLFTIFEDEWLYRQSQVKNKLLYAFGMMKERVFARECVVKNCTMKEKVEFFENNHIQGSGPGSVTYKLVWSGETVAMMTFIKKVGGEWILNRYATSRNVVGGFSKLLVYFERENSPRKVVTFADRRWSSGGVYEKNGFNLDGVLGPDYRYVIEDRRVHKFNFRHKNLGKLLENYDELLSEVENTRNHDLYRIFDCGLKRFVKYY